jgi:hypothetical protein
LDKKIVSILFLGLVLLFAGNFVSAAPWDPLRPTVNLTAALEPLVNWLLLIVSGFIFGIAFLAWKKSSSKKLLWVSVAFGLFFAKRILSLADTYLSPGTFFNIPVQSAFDLAIMICLAIALFRK